jgi:thiamine kinase-like enzyme
LEIRKILKQIDAVSISPDATITQLRHEEDDSFYQVWRIDTKNSSYILKQAKENEAEIYQSILAPLKVGIPTLYQTITIEDQIYLLMEYIEGENLCKCNRTKLTAALKALIALQEETWETDSIRSDSKLEHRQNRGKYLNDSLLEKAYDRFLRVYQSTPKALCHDDLLPFNVIASDHKAVLIDWETGGILPYPTSFARLIAHAEEDPEAFFYMAKEDKEFAIDYYYAHLLKDKGISYAQWRDTLEFFLFYEYCEWVYVGNKYNATDGEYYKKYLPIAKKQAEKLLSMD